MLSEAELVVKAQMGCGDSFAELVRRNSERLFNFLRRRTGNADLSEDLVQDTFVRAYEKLGSYRKESKFSTWLFTIALRLSISHHRRKRPEQLGSVKLVCPNAGPDDVAIQKELDGNLWDVVSQLPTSQRQALELRYGGDMPIAEIAKVMNKTKVHVKVILYRGRIGMAKRLGTTTDNESARLIKPIDNRLIIRESAGV